MPQPHSAVGAHPVEEERAELTAVLNSKHFARAQTLSRILAHICEKYFDGETDDLKEYSIAVEALGRKPDFDPQEDAIVRVHTHLLRKRLADYYASEGAGHRLHIELPVGQYVPRFIKNAGNGPDPVAAPEHAALLDRSAAAANRLYLAKHFAPLVRRWALPMAAVVLVTSASVLAWRTRAHARARNLGATVAAASAEKLVRAVTPPAVLTPPVRILAGRTGGGFTDRSGRLWQEDGFFKGGTVFSRGDRPVARTLDPQMFLAGREGQSEYAIPVPPGTYEVHVYLAETSVTGEAMRFAPFTINGLTSNVMDIVNDAGGANAADEKIFPGEKPEADGRIHLAFLSPESYVNAIEILPSEGNAMLPVRFTASSESHVDRRGRTWLADEYFSGGRQMPVSGTVAGADDPALFNTERFGNFSYSIPVVEHRRYKVTLYFSEHWFGENFDHKGVGGRVFDVYCNGKTLLKNFDILREAGGDHRAVVRTFHRLEPTAQGKLNLSFVPSVNYALVNAIEVAEEP